MEWIVTGFEVTGVAILVLGSLVALVSAAATLRRGKPQGQQHEQLAGSEAPGRSLELTAAYKRAREGVGRAILLGLEILIIADIVLTITVDRTLDSALTLGLIVLVRTFLSFSLEIELEGSLPWRRSTAGRKPARATEVPSTNDSAEREA
jgi:hypothetical protein